MNHLNDWFGLAIPDCLKTCVAILVLVLVLVLVLGFGVGKILVPMQREIEKE